MIDNESPEGSWKAHLDLMRVNGVKSVCVDRCRAAPWHYDESSIQRIRKISELCIQAQIVQGLPLMIDCMVSSVPNGGKRGFVAQRHVKKEGLTKGYPDLIIDGLGENRGKVFRAEIKANGRLSVDQYEILNTLWDNGHKCGLFRSLDTLVDAMKQEGWV